MPLDFSLRFLIVLGSILVPFWPPKWSPGDAAEVRKSAGGRSKTVLGSSWFGPFFVLRFGITFLSLLGHSWGRFWSLLGVSWARLGSSWARFGALRMACWGLIVLYSHQLIDLSSFQPAARQHLTSRPGGLREAIKLRRKT